MRGLVLVAAVAVLVSVPVLAGTYLMNDTGQTVAGLRVTFSEPVTITAFGDALRRVDPVGQATQFTFSDGEVSSSGGEWFNWEPASASIVSSEWLSETPTAPADTYGPGSGADTEMNVEPTGSAGIALSVDSTALPLLLRIESLDGEGPFSVDVAGTDPRGKCYEIRSSAAKQPISVAIPWNRYHSIQVSVEDSSGLRVTQTVECEYRIRQNELFALDATRYGDSLHLSLIHI